MLSLHVPYYQPYKTRVNLRPFLLKISHVKLDVKRADEEIGTNIFNSQLWLSQGILKTTIQ